MTPEDRTQESWGPEIFDRLYAEHPDPWRFESSAYEQAKYADTLAQLPPGRSGDALELGCSIGVLTEQLAARCDRLLGLDGSGAALARARLRCAGLGHVRFQRAVLPRDWPSGAFDLILISELLYFLAPGDIAILASRSVHASRPGCTILLVNWTGPTDTPTTGDQAAELFRSACDFIADAPLRRHGYRLDRLRRPAA